jgi:hypothetical protein
MQIIEESISREKLIRTYIAACVWNFGIVSGEYIASVFNFYEDDKTTPDEILSVGASFCGDGEVFAKRRSLFVSAYAFDGWRYSEIVAFSEKMPPHRTLTRDEIMLYADRAYDPTFPAKEKLRLYLHGILGSSAPICLNNIEKEIRLGRLNEDFAMEILVEYSGGKPLNTQKRTKFLNLVREMIKGCTCWVKK